jgi:hypothetical protein
MDHQPLVLEPSGEDINITELLASVQRDRDLVREAADYDDAIRLLGWDVVDDETVPEEHSTIGSIFAMLDAVEAELEHQLELGVEEEAYQD